MGNTGSTESTLMLDYNEVYNLAVGAAVGQVLIQLIAVVTIFFYWKYFKHLFTSKVSHLPTGLVSKFAKKIQFL